MSFGPENKGGYYGGGDLWGDQGGDYKAWEREHMRRQRNVAVICAALVLATFLCLYLFLWVFV